MKKKKEATIKKASSVTLQKKKVPEEKKLREAIGMRIREKRKANGFSAQYIANHLGMSRSALSLIEMGRNNVNGITLWKLASLLDCSEEVFFPPKATTAKLTRSEVKVLLNEDDDVENWAKKLNLL